MTIPEASRGERQPMDAAALLASLTGLSPSAAACRYAEAGIPVFPCVTGGKRPLTKRGFHEASTEPRQVARWWARWPRANIGMPTGQISGLEVVDVDVHGAIRGFAAFELARREGLTDRWAAFIRTPSGGVHAYYPADPELVQPSWQVARAGIDFRGSGGYVIVPPSIIATDAGPSAYALIGSGRGDAVPVDARALRQFLDPRPARPMPVIPVERTDDIDVERIARWVGMRGEGERNRGLFWASCRLIEAGIPPDRVRAALGPAAERAGLPTPEIETTIRSAHRVARGAQSAPTASSVPSHSSSAFIGSGALVIPGSTQQPRGRIAVWTAVAGTVFIAAAAFWLSFTALADLARRSGVDESQAWAWPLIVDGIIVVATVSVVALAGQRAAWYPWLLLMAGAAVSVAANAIHAVVAADADVPSALAGSVAAVPPLVLLAITHLTVVLTRRFRGEPLTQTAELVSSAVEYLSPEPSAHLAPRELALRLKEDGMTNTAIARATGVHPSTVGRWLATPALSAASEGGAL